jgi:hypothetical protein
MKAFGKTSSKEIKTNAELFSGQHTDELFALDEL